MTTPKVGSVQHNAMGESQIPITVFKSHPSLTISTYYNSESKPYALPNVVHNKFIQSNRSLIDDGIKEEVYPLSV